MANKEYHKIETLCKFDQETKKFIPNTFYNPSVEILQNHQWLFTEKVDGTNFRIYWNGHTLSYAGRTDNAIFSKDQIAFIEANLINEAMTNSFETMFREKEVIVYGELYGNKIQKDGHLYTNNNGLAFKVFDVCKENQFMPYEHMIHLCKEIGYDVVPLVLTGTIAEGIVFVENNLLSTFSKATLEGLVGKPVGNFLDYLGNRIVVKIKRRDLISKGVIQ
jgi:ATP-dependent RNA circularization protein (DNA/RNA ligase family)